MADFDEVNNRINVTWTDDSNSQDDNLQYQITYSVSARDVTLLNRSDVASGNQYLIEDNVLPGVTFDVTVLACNDFGVGTPTSTSATVPGGTYLYRL